MLPKLLSTNNRWFLVYRTLQGLYSPRDGGVFYKPVIWNINRVTWIVIIPSNLLQIHDFQEPTNLKSEQLAWQILGTTWSCIQSASCHPEPSQSILHCLGVHILKMSKGWKKYFKTFELCRFHFIMIHQDNPLAAKVEVNSCPVLPGSFPWKKNAPSKCIPSGQVSLQ